MGAMVRLVVMPFWPRRRPPNDALSAEVAPALLEGVARERLTAEMYVPDFDEPGLGILEKALRMVVRGAPVEKKLRHLVREGKIDDAPPIRLAARALQAGLITEDEHTCFVEAEEARREAIEVDAFDSAQFSARSKLPDVSTITSAARFAPMSGDARRRS